MIEKENKINIKNINSYANRVQKSISKLYGKVYNTDDSNVRSLESIKNNIDSTLKSISDNNFNNVGSSNIAALYTRIQDKNMNIGDNKFLGDVQSLFEDQNLINGILPSFAQNRNIKKMEEEIDIICKYMPILQDALDCKKDNVLSSDKYSNRFIFTNNTDSVTDNDIIFSNKSNTIINKYNLYKLFNTIYDNVSKYGEEFIYIADYTDEIKKLLNNKNNNFGIREEYIIEESYNINENNINTSDTLDVKIYNGILESAIVEKAKIELFKDKIQKNPLNKSVLDGVSLQGLGSEKMNDGITELDKELKNLQTNTGCIVKRLKRENIIPIYIDDICLGYYYLECDFTDTMNRFDELQNPLGKSRNEREILQNNNNMEILKNISGKLSASIDAKFVTANSDLQNEIYFILKNNEILNNNGQIKVSYLSPDSVVHCKFNENENHRGISDLENALIPATLFIGLYINYVIGTLTRSADKRVYYVKQQIDSNISQLMLTTINQIKKGNYGAREFSSLKNMLNISGKYNDFIVPLSSSGDSPIQFEMMPGQEIRINEELLNLLRQMAVNSTDVPYEFVDSINRIDFATKLTMTSGKFLRSTMNRQGVCNEIYSTIMSKIWKYEYNEDKDINVTLPPPAFLNMLNTNEMTENIIRYCDQITEMEMSDEENDTVKMIFNKKIKKSLLGNHLDTNLITRLKEEAILEAKVKMQEET